MDHKVKEISIKEIYMGDNSRLEIEKEDLSDLMESIKQHGLLQAIGVVLLKGKEKKNGKKYKVIYGNRRLTAFKKLRKRFIPAKIEHETKDLASQIILNLIENDQRKGIDSFEFGRSCNHLIENLGYTLREVAVALSSTPSRIKGCIDIFKQLPSEFSGQIKTMPYGVRREETGDIPSSMAKTVVQMQRKYSLKKHQVTQVLNLIKTNKSLSNRSLNHAMYFMSQGMSLTQALLEVNKHVIRRYEFSVPKKQAELLEAKYGSLNRAIHEILYKSGEITPPRADEK